MDSLKNVLENYLWIKFVKKYYTISSNDRQNYRDDKRKLHIYGQIDGAMVISYKWLEWISVAYSRLHYKENLDAIQKMIECIRVKMVEDWIIK